MIKSEQNLDASSLEAFVPDVPFVSLSRGRGRPKKVKRCRKGGSHIFGVTTREDSASTPVAIGHLCEFGCS